MKWPLASKAVIGMKSYVQGGITLKLLLKILKCESRGVWLLPITLVTIFYFLSGRIGLLLAVPPFHATALFPPTGIALASVLILGNRIWPGIWLGSFFLNVWLSVDLRDPPLNSLFASACIGMGASLQALIAAYLVRRTVGFPTALTEERDVAKFFGFGGLVACLLSPIMGSISLYLAGLLDGPNFWFNCWTWWVGDTLGVILVTPLIFILAAEPRELWWRRRYSVTLPVCFGLLLTTLLFLFLYENPHYYSNWHMWAFMAGGVFFSSILGASLLVITGRRWLVEQVVLDRTKELQLANQELQQRMEELRRSEERFRLLVSGAKDYAIFMVDPAGSIINWNEGAERLYGYPEADIMGKSISCLHPAEDAISGKTDRMFVTAQDFGVCEEQGWRLRKDGTRLWVNVLVTTLYNEKRECIGFSKITRDLTESRKRENELSNSVKFIKLLHVVSSAATHASDPKKLLQFCLDEVCALTGWPVGHAYLLSKDSDALLIPTGIWHFDTPGQFGIFKKKTEETPMPVGVGLPGRVLATGKPFWVFDVNTVKKFPRAQAAAEVGLIAGFGFPIVVDESVIGVMEFFSLKGLEPDHSLSEVMHRIGVQIGQVIQKHQFEEALIQSEERYRHLFESARDIIATSSLDGKITSLNPAFESILGWTRQEWIGRPYFELIHPDDLPRVRMSREALISGRLPPVIEARVRTKEGGYRFVESIGKPLIEEGKVVGGFSVIRDVTARRQAEEKVKQAHENLERQVAERTVQLQKANEDLKKSNAELEQFASIASHDLREPLRTISSYVSLLGREYGQELNPEAMGYFQFIQDAAVRLQQLINDLLDYSKVGSSRVIEESVDCKAVLEEVVSDLKIPIEESKAEIQIDTLPTVIGDAVQIGRLFQNLMSNSVKYRSHNSLKIRIACEKNTASNWTFSVRDNGIGFDMQYANRVFEIFRRLHRKDEYPGTGIGLAICKKIVERHGGKIWVESQPGVGTTFYFTLRGELKNEKPLGGMKILLVDDAKDIQLLIGRGLRLTGGASVDIASNGDEGIRMAMAGRYDVVLMDIQMPLLDGFEATSTLRESGFEKPIIAFTSHRIGRDELSREKKGFDDYLHKDCDLETIIGKLRQFQLTLRDAS